MGLGAGRGKHSDISTGKFVEMAVLFPESTNAFTLCPRCPLGITTVGAQPSAQGCSEVIVCSSRLK